MSTETQDLIEICDQLPEAKRAEVVDFARFLLAQEGDAAWEALIGAEQTRPKLKAFLAEAKVGSDTLTRHLRTARRGKESRGR